MITREQQPIIGRALRAAELRIERGGSDVVGSASETHIGGTMYARGVKDAMRSLLTGRYPKELDDFVAEEEGILTGKRGHIRTIRTDFFGNGLEAGKRGDMEEFVVEAALDVFQSGRMINQTPHLCPELDADVPDVGVVREKVKEIGSFINGLTQSSRRADLFSIVFNEV